MNEFEKTVRGMFVSYDNATSREGRVLVIRPDYLDDPREFYVPNGVYVDWEGEWPQSGDAVTVTYDLRTGGPTQVQNRTTNLREIVAGVKALKEQSAALKSQVKHLQRQVAVLQKTR